MLGRLTSRDSVAMAGSLLGLATVFTSWLSLKPNRLAAGSGESVWQSLDWWAAALLLVIWLACLVLSLNLRGRRRAIGLGLTANLALATTLLLFGTAASQITAVEPEFSRVSPSAGIWLTITAVYVLVFASRQRLAAGDIWRHVIFWIGPLILAAILLSGWLNDVSIIVEFSGRSQRFFQELRQHVFLFGTAVIIGSVIGIWLAIWATRNRRVERPVFFLANITQTIPSLALFGLLIAPLSALSFSFPFLRELGVSGVGTTPALIALVIYSLLPIMRNTFVGLRQVDSAAIDAGRGMGMSRGQLFRRVEMPLAAPLVAEGVRIASVQSVGLAAVAALIGAGGLGFFIFQGFGSATDLILLGAIPIIILALAVDAVMRLVIRLVTPKGVVGGMA